MKTACHYEGSDLVPCEKMAGQKSKFLSKLCVYFSDSSISTSINFCPFCGESLKQPESSKIEAPFWVTKGMVIKHKWQEHQVCEIISVKGDYVTVQSDYTNKANMYISVIIDRFKPIGGPFDTKPKWATHIEFYHDDQNLSDWGGMFKDTNNRKYLYFPIWHDCPEEFKGKTYSLEGLE